MNRSAVLITLLGTQAISLMSLFLWLFLFAMLFSAGKLWESSQALFLLYPLLPLCLSAYAWVVFRAKKYRNAIIASSIPALVSFSLMTYYYVIGITTSR